MTLESLDTFQALAQAWVTGNSRKAGALREDVSHRLKQHQSLCEAFSKAIHSWSKQAASRNRSIEEGNFFCLFHLHHREPEVALYYYQAGHRMPDGLVGGFGGT